MSFTTSLDFHDGVAILAAKPVDTAQKPSAMDQTFANARKLDATFDHDLKQKENRGELIAMEMIRRDMQRAVESSTRMQKKEKEPTEKAQQNAVKQVSQNFFDTEINVYIANLTQPKQDVSLCERLNSLGSCFVSSANAAIAAGGHVRTWNGVLQAGNSLTTLSSGLKNLKTADNFLDFGLGYWSVATSAFSLIISLFGNDDDGDSDWREEVYSMLQKIYNALQSSVQKIENILVECVCKRLSLICTKLDRVESIMCVSFRELHRKDLLDIADLIGKCLRKEITLSNKEKRLLLQRLATWIDCHCGSPIQVAQNRADANSVTIFREIVDAQQPQNSITFIFALISLLVPSFKPVAIPNWELFFFTTKLYSIAQQKWNLAESSHSLYDRVEKTLEKVHQNIALIDKNVVNCLIRQFQHRRFQLGRALAKARVEFGGEETMRQKIDKLSVEHRDNILQIIDSMELLRFLYGSLHHIVPDISSLSAIDDFLESKTFPPDRVGLFSRAVTIRNRDPFTTAEKGECGEMDEFLQKGLDVNSHNGWGYLLLKYVHNGANSAIGLHGLLKCDGIVTNEGSRYGLGDTWPVGSRPIQYILNHCAWRMAIIFVANGYDIDAGNYGAHWLNGGVWRDCGNLHHWASTGNVNGLICLQFVYAMQDPSSQIHRDKLRAAYQYYKKYEAGVEGNYNGSKEALFLIICLLGILPHDFNLNGIDLKKPVVAQGLTWLDIAKAAKTYNVQQFIEKKEPKKKEQTFAPFYISVGKLRSTFTQLSIAEKERMANIDRHVTSDQQIFIDLIEPFANTPNLQTLFVQLKRADNRDDFLSILNLLNASIKVANKSYSIGTNVDIFLQQSLNKNEF